ncbi:hypothetical protein D3C72_2048910 [compost metagenome]
MIFLLRPDIGVAINHIGREMHEPLCTSFIHRFDDVFRAVIIDREEEIVTLGPHLKRRQHLSREIIDHIVGANAELADRLRIGDIGMNESRITIMRQIALHDVSDNNFMPIGKKQGRQISSNKPVTT